MVAFMILLYSVREFIFQDKQGTTIMETEREENGMLASPMSTKMEHFEKLFDELSKLSRKTHIEHLLKSNTRNYGVLKSNMEQISKLINEYPNKSNSTLDVILAIVRDSLMEVQNLNAIMKKMNESKQTDVIPAITTPQHVEASKKPPNDLVMTLKETENQLSSAIAKFDIQLDLLSRKEDALTEKLDYIFTFQTQAKDVLNKIFANTEEFHAFMENDRVDKQDRDDIKAKLQHVSILLDKMLLKTPQSQTIAPVEVVVTQPPADGVPTSIIDEINSISIREAAEIRRMLSNLYDKFNAIDRISNLLNTTSLQLDQLMDQCKTKKILPVNLEDTLDTFASKLNTIDKTGRDISIKINSLNEELLNLSPLDKTTERMRTDIVAIQKRVNELATQFDVSAVATSIKEKLQILSDMATKSQLSQTETAIQQSNDKYFNKLTKNLADLGEPAQQIDLRKTDKRISAIELQQAQANELLAGVAQNKDVISTNEKLDNIDRRQIDVSVSTNKIIQLLETMLQEINARFDVVRVAQETMNTSLSDIVTKVAALVQSVETLKLNIPTISSNMDWIIQKLEDTSESVNIGYRLNQLLYNSMFSSDQIMAFKEKLRTLILYLPFHHTETDILAKVDDMIVDLKITDGAIKTDIRAETLAYIHWLRPPPTIKHITDALQHELRILLASTNKSLDSLTAKMTNTLQTQPTNDKIDQIVTNLANLQQDKIVKSLEMIQNTVMPKYRAIVGIKVVQSEVQHLLDIAFKRSNEAFPYRLSITQHEKNQLTKFDEGLKSVRLKIESLPDDTTQESVYKAISMLDTSQKSMVQHILNNYKQSLLPYPIYYSVIKQINNLVNDRTSMLSKKLENVIMLGDKIQKLVGINSLNSKTIENYIRSFPLPDSLKESIETLNLIKLSVGDCKLSLEKDRDMIEENMSKINAKLDELPKNFANIDKKINELFEELFNKFRMVIKDDTQKLHDVIVSERCSVFVEHMAVHLIEFVDAAPPKYTVDATRPQDVIRHLNLYSSYLILNRTSGYMNRSKIIIDDILNDYKIISTNLNTIDRYYNFPMALIKLTILMQSENFKEVRTSVYRILQNNNVLVYAMPTTPHKLLYTLPILYSKSLLNCTYPTILTNIPFKYYDDGGVVGDYQELFDLYDNRKVASPFYHLPPIENALEKVLHPTITYNVLAGKMQFEKRPKNDTLKPMYGFHIMPSISYLQYKTETMSFAVRGQLKKFPSYLPSDEILNDAIRRIMARACVNESNTQTEFGIMNLHTFANVDKRLTDNETIVTNPISCVFKYAMVAIMYQQYTIEKVNVIETIYMSLNIPDIFIRIETQSNDHDNVDIELPVKFRQNKDTQAKKIREEKTYILNQSENTTILDMEYRYNNYNVLVQSDGCYLMSEAKPLIFCPAKCDFSVKRLHDKFLLADDYQYYNVT